MHRPRQTRVFLFVLLFPAFLFATTMNISCDPKVTEKTGETTPEVTTETTTETTPEEGTNPPDGGTETTPDGGPTETISEPSPDQPTQPSVEEAANKLTTPLDATPSPNGDFNYFTAVLAPNTAEPNLVEGQGAVFKVEKGKAPQELAKGFFSPLSVVVSTDGQTLFVADRGQAKPEDEESDDTKTGGIYTVASTGGQPALLTGTLGYQPRGLDIIKESNEDMVYFSGVDPSDGQAGVFKIKASGGSVTAVLKGNPLRDPSGLAVTSAGKVYVADAKTETNTSSTIYEVSNGQATVFMEGMRVGYPAGIAFTKNEQTLLISGLQSQENSSVVYLVKVSDKTLTEFSQGISQNSESGGVHRAHNTNTFAWANSDAPDATGAGGGTVYTIKLPATP